MNDSRSLVRVFVSLAFVLLALFIVVYVSFQQARLWYWRLTWISLFTVLVAGVIAALDYLLKKKSRRTIGNFLFDEILCLNQPKGRAEDKDGYGMFGALAGFALAQGAALTAVAKGEGKDNLVLGIYLFAVLFTVGWTRTMLIVKQSSDQRVFNEASLTFGEWTLAWNVVLGATMFILGLFNLLPNQQSRELYTRTGPIQCKTLPMEEHANKNPGFDWWLKRISHPDTKLLWIESEAGFDANYRTFEAVLELQSRFTLEDPVAFLLTQDSPADHPIYEQIPARYDDESKKWELTLDEPDEGQRIVVFAFVTDSLPNVGVPEDIASIVPHFQND